MMAKLAHPNVVTIFESGETKNGQLYFVMELMQGTDLARMIAEQGRLSAELARSVCLHVCDAVGAAHEMGIVHRDIKPANVLISTKGVVKVGDFGLARLETSDESGLTRTGFMVGTPDFLAPEASQHGVELDGRADIYAVGVMLYQMLTGSLPRGAFKPASVLVPGLDRHFDSVISRAMQTRPDDRYATAAQMRHDLEQLSVVLNFRETKDSTMAVPVGVLTAERQAQRPVTKISGVAAAPDTALSPKTPARKKRTWLTEKMTRTLTALLAILLCAAAGWLALRRVGEGVVTLSYDLPFVVHRPGGAGDVCLVYLDQLEGDLLDRRVQAPLLAKLQEAGARAVVYDVIFDREWPDKAVDEAFAEAMKKFRAGGGVLIGADASGVVPAGPMPGPEMLQAALLVAEMENAALQKLGLHPRDFERFSKLTSGVRRKMLEFPNDVSASLNPDSAIEVSFTLSAGTYATIVLQELAAKVIDVALQEALASHHHAASTEED